MGAECPPVAAVEEELQGAGVGCLSSGPKPGVTPSQDFGF